MGLQFLTYQTEIEKNVNVFLDELAQAFQAHGFKLSSNQLVELDGLDESQKTIAILYNVIAHKARSEFGILAITRNSSLMGLLSLDDKLLKKMKANDASFASDTGLDELQLQDTNESLGIRLKINLLEIIKKHHHNALMVDMLKGLKRLVERLRSLSGRGKYNLLEATDTTKTLLPYIKDNWFGAGTKMRRFDKYYHERSGGTGEAPHIMPRDLKVTYTKVLSFLAGLLGEHFIPDFENPDASIAEGMDKLLEKIEILMDLSVRFMEQAEGSHEKLTDLSSAILSYYAAEHIVESFSGEHKSDDKNCSENELGHNAETVRGGLLGGLLSFLSSDEIKDRLRRLEQLLSDRFTTANDNLQAAVDKYGKIDPSNSDAKALREQVAVLTIVLKEEDTARRELAKFERLGRFEKWHKNFEKNYQSLTVIEEEFTKHLRKRESEDINNAVSCLDEYHKNQLAQQELTVKIASIEDALSKERAEIEKLRKQLGEIETQIEAFVKEKETKESQVSLEGGVGFFGVLSNIPKLLWSKEKLAAHAAEQKELVGQCERIEADVAALEKEKLQLLESLDRIECDERVHREELVPFKQQLSEIEAKLQSQRVDISQFGETVFKKQIAAILDKPIEDVDESDEAQLEILLEKMQIFARVSQVDKNSLEKSYQASRNRYGLYQNFRLGLLKFNEVYYTHQQEWLNDCLSNRTLSLKGKLRRLHLLREAIHQQQADEQVSDSVEANCNSNSVTIKQNPFTGEAINESPREACDDSSSENQSVPQRVISIPCSEIEAIALMRCSAKDADLHVSAEHLIDHQVERLAALDSLMGFHEEILNASQSLQDYLRERHKHYYSFDCMQWVGHVFTFGLFKTDKSERERYVRRLTNAMQASLNVQKKTPELEILLRHGQSFKASSDPDRRSLADIVQNIDRMFNRFEQPAEPLAQISDESLTDAALALSATFSQ